MPIKATMLYLQTLSPLHSGTGQGSGFIDLPVSRDPTTNWPDIPGSGVKGALRTACDGRIAPSDIDALFGSELNASESAGKLWPSSARLLCYPVRSFKGTFAWVTCPLALQAWRRDYETIGAPLTLELPDTVADTRILTSSKSASPLSTKRGDTTRVLLEDLDLDVNDEHEALVDAIADRIAAAIFADRDWTRYFKARFGIVSDDTFTFLTTMTMPVTAHIRINDDSKTVATGALWYEETVPAETIFTLPVVDRQGDLIATFAPAIDKAFQLGGNASVGQGVVRARLDQAPLAESTEATVAEGA